MKTLHHSFTLLRPVLAFVAFLLAFPALAHKSSDSYLSLQFTNNTVEAQWDIALRDLDFHLGLDADDDGSITWGEVRRSEAALFQLVSGHLRLSADGTPLALLPGELMIAEHVDGAYAVIRFQAKAGDFIGALTAEYNLFFADDPLHRGLYQCTHGTITETGVFSPEARIRTFAAGVSSAAAGFSSFVRDGIHHIWAGMDHILFIVTLILPAVLFRRPAPSGKRLVWQGVPAFRPAFWSLFKVATAFTIAHSITLCLATLGWVRLPSRPVEFAIAFSVALAASNNVRPWMHGHGSYVAFGFGLIHGFGFAGVLADLNLPASARISGLLGFNVGVEIGQVILLAAAFPIMFLIRRSWFYQRVILQGGSLIIVIIAILWMLERGLDRKWLPF